MMKQAERLDPSVANDRRRQPYLAKRDLADPAPGASPYSRA
jgi:hypothetical protein